MTDTPLNGQKAAFQASVHGIRTVGGRKVIQVVLEAPIEFQSEIARICEHDAWVAVARIQKPEGKATPDKKRWADLAPAQQAGILCADTDFQEYLNRRDEPEAIKDIHWRCGIKSRKELASNQEARSQWNSIVTDFRIWQQARA